MPVRKDHSYAMGTSVGVCKLTNEQFQKIEQDGRLTLSASLRKRLSEARLWYPLNKSAENNASTSADQLENLKKASECINFLKRFLDKSTEDHAIYGARDHVEEELFSLISVENIQADPKTFNVLPDLNISISQIQKRIQENNENGIAQLIDFKRLTADLAFLKIAIEKVRRKLVEANTTDNGGLHEDWPLNELLSELQKIYDKAPGKKKAFEKFCTSVISTLPKHVRPILPRSPSSITRRANRLKKKKSS